ncbi:hypothetical protein L2E82_08352 [Cichorium intybus]|uniref:Uncharacterized protein n=1 Tax=Cichorium intybus TaxID=13427 RepID=A0ACB9G879_CICIN|nr:hypothetical protein L2E82_08352 [Cichorium intybus]
MLLFTTTPSLAPPQSLPLLYPLPCYTTSVPLLHPSLPNFSATTILDRCLLERKNKITICVHGLKDPDEDFGILLEPAMMYDRRVAALLNENDSNGEHVLWKDINDGKTFSYPRLLFVITGKGPEKETYEEKIKKLNLKRVSFRTMWLSPDDYPSWFASW